VTGKRSGQLSYDPPQASIISDQILCGNIDLMTNLEIAELLRDVAASYQLQDAQKFRFQIIAYERASDAVEHASSELKDLWDDGKLEDVPGIGPSIAQHLDELFKTGKSKHFESLMKDIPKEAFKLMQLPGIGIKTAMKLLKEGDPKDVKEKLAEVSTREKIDKRHLLPYAAQIASGIMDWMLKDSRVKRVDPLGSLRRKASTVGDIDLACVTSQPVEVLTHFTKYPQTQKILEKGEHSASILIPGNIQVDMMVQPAESYGSLLQHFTGSKHHNIALRDYALKKGLSLNEYGISKIEQQRKVDKNSPLRGQIGKTKFKAEKDFYNFLGLDYIEPELREDTGEIEAAKVHKLPKLIDLTDIKSDLQIHSSFDIETSHDLGESSMEEIVKKGNGLKYEYLAFTEHNPSQKGHTDAQIVDILKRKRQHVDKINSELRRGLLRETSEGRSEKVEQLNYSNQNRSTAPLRQGFGRVKKVFNSLEIDMKPDGTLPVPDTGMETLDFALVSIHSSFDLDRISQTKRVLSALDHPKVKIFAHPTGRKLNEREGAELNWPEIFDFCLKKNKWIEINCDPMRLDLPDILVREAVKLGVKLTFGTDAHHMDGMNNMVWGLSVARRGWAEKKDIVNTKSLKEFEEMLR
jgi:DNA polymerase (family 10)